MPSISELLPLTEAEERERAAIGLTHAQFLIWRDPARFRVAVCGRRFGKTHLGITEVVRAAQTGIGKTILIVSPSIKQTRMLFWSKLVEIFSEADLIAEKNATHMEIRLKHWKTLIKLGGADNGDGLRGLSVDFLLIDEFALVPAEIWFEVLRPMLSDKMGEALFISTPRGMANWAYDLFLRAEHEANHAAFSFTTRQGGNVPPEEIEEAQRNLTSEQFRQEYEAAFGSKSALVYPNFERKVHVTKEAEDTGEFPLLIGIDPGVSPYVGVVAEKVADDHINVFDVIDLYGGHTQAFCLALEERYWKEEWKGKKRRPIYCYPDPAARQNRSSAGGMTDFFLLAEAGFKVYAPSKISVRDRVNCLNAAFRTASGSHRLFVHPRCVALIKALEMQGWGDDGKPMKGRDAAGADHYTDALGYLIWSAMPLRRQALSVMQTSGW